MADSDQKIATNDEENAGYGCILTSRLSVRFIHFNIFHIIESTFSFTRIIVYIQFNKIYRLILKL